MKSSNDKNVTATRWTLSLFAGALFAGGLLAACGAPGIDDFGNPDLFTQESAVTATTLSFGSVSDRTVDVFMSSSDDVAGFQFSLDGADITGASGGSVEANGFSIATNADLIMGYSLTGSVIPAGYALLTEVSFNTSANEICFVDVVISDSSSNDINSTGNNVCVAVTSCSQLGDLNGDGGWNVLDIVTLANCVLADNCTQLTYGCAGDLNGDGGWNVLDIVTLANCVLAGNCGP